MRDTSPHPSSETERELRTDQKDGSKGSEGDRPRSGDRSQHSRSPDFAAEPRFQPWYEASKKRLEGKFGERFRENLPKEHYDQMQQELQEEFDRNEESLSKEFYQKSSRIQEQFKRDRSNLCSSTCDQFEKLKTKIESGLTDALKEDTKELLKALPGNFLKLRKEQRENPKGEKEHSEEIRKLYDDFLSKKEPYRSKRNEVSKDLKRRIEGTIALLKENEIYEVSSFRGTEISSKFSEEGLESEKKWKPYVEDINRLKGEYNQKRSKFDLKLLNSLNKANSDNDKAQTNLREALSNASHVLEDLKKQTTHND